MAEPLEHESIIVLHRTLVAFVAKEKFASIGKIKRESEWTVPRIRLLVKKKDSIKNKSRQSLLIKENGGTIIPEE
jgi:hypothetical protein